MRVLITGARGFVGSSLAEYASKRGHEVLGIGRTTQAPSDWYGGYAWADVALSDLVPIINGFRPDLLLHCAGSASVGASFASPMDDLRANVLTLTNTLDGIRRSEVRPLVVFPSSAAVYGNPANLPVREDEPCRPISPYGFHKLAAETAAHEYATCYGVQVIICRIFSLIGERQRRLLLWDLYQQFAGESSEVVLQGTGDETRDFMHIDDLCDIFLRFHESRTAFLKGDYTVNCASGIETSVRAVAMQVKGILGSDKRLIFLGKQRLGDPSRWLADCSKLAPLRSNMFPELSDAIAQVLTKWTKIRFT
jgi:UDP-glucose 4-epimerase